PEEVCGLPVQRGRAVRARPGAVRLPLCGPARPGRHDHRLPALRDAPVALSNRKISFSRPDRWDTLGGGCFPVLAAGGPAMTATRERVSAWLICAAALGVCAGKDLPPGRARGDDEAREEKEALQRRRQRQKDYYGDVLPAGARARLGS